MPKRLPIGISDYKMLIEGDYYYVDKTLLVKELVENSGIVTLIPRPRRFGKTLNLSMLNYFFEKPLDGQNTSDLFTKTAIWQDEKYRAMQGQYSVIFLSFKEVKENNWEDAYLKIQTLIAKEYQRYQKFITTHKNIINPNQFDIFNQIAAESANKVHVDQSLKSLTELLHAITKKRVVVLLDEYDTPIHASYVNGYYQEMTHFIRNLFTAVLKDNSSLERGVLTGILRTAKEGIFSGLNNLDVCTLLSDSFADKFGFVSNEIEAFLKDQGLEDQSTLIKAWYNGYHIGDNVLVYNPWSMLECAKNQGKLQPYWVNTSDNAIIKKILIRSTNEVKIELENILNNIPVIKEIDDAMIFPGIERNERAVWSLLFFSGYLTYSEKILTEDGKKLCTLCIPNKEVETLYRNFLADFFNESLDASTLKALLIAMIGGDIEIFSATLQEFVLNSMSCHDLPDTEPEKSYHLFVLGLLVLLTNQYHVTSNRESGYGRYDIMLIPKDQTQTGLVIEFKKAPSPNHFAKTCQEALDQIKEKKYAHELGSHGIKNIIIYGIAFFQKKLMVVAEKIITH